MLVTDALGPLKSALSGQYELERELPGGGMSRVFLAHDVTYGRAVVIKVLPTETAGAVSVERFRREMQVVARLQQANIVPLIVAGEANGLPYYVMPYVEGESLRARLVRDGELPIADAIGILREVARALAYAHDHGIVHRDIKPDNVLLSGGSAVVTDFGVAKALVAAALGDARIDTKPGLTSLGVALGTPAYMSPEQASADPAVDHRADIYALGAMGYELLTGQTPFSGRPLAAMLAAHVTETPDAIQHRRSSIPPALAALLMRCLEKRPADRPQRALDVVHVLDALVTPTSGSLPSPKAPPERRFRRTFVAAAALVLVLVVAVAWQLRKPATTSPIRSIAVLPFENVGGDTTITYFVDGMRDELATALAKVPGLSVASRNSSYLFRDKKTAIADIGRQLGVDAVLEGSVRQSTGKLRVSAQLTRVPSGLSAWASSFELRMTDVFAVQEQFGREISAALGSALTSPTAPGLSVAATRGTQDEVAWDHFQRGRHLLNERLDIPKVVELFRMATEQDPRYGRAYAGMASGYALLPYFNGASSVEILPTLRAVATQALALDSTLSEPHAALGLGLAQTFAWEESEREFRRAIALDSTDVAAFLWLGYVLAGIDRWAEALPLSRHAVKLDPLSPTAQANLAFALMRMGHFDEALAVAARLSETSPNEPVGYDLRAAVFLSKGDWLSAEREYERSPHGSKWKYMQTYVYAQRGRRREADSLISLVKDSSSRAGRVTDVAAAYAAIGDADHAFEWLNRAIDRHDGGLLGTDLLRGEWYSSIRHDRRFALAMKRMGLRASP